MVVQISATSERFMRREFIESNIFMYLEENLRGLDIIPKYMVDSRSFTWFGEKSSMGASATKKAPKTVSVSSEFPEVEITRMEAKSGMLNRKGFKAILDRDAITQNVTDDLNRAFKNLAFSLASDLNAEVFSTLVNSGTPDGVSHTDWSAVDANVVEDLRLTKNAMKRSGYPYRADKFYVNEEQWEELEGFLFFYDTAGGKQNILMGWPNVDGDTINIPGLGADVTRVDDGIDAGTILTLDSSNPAASMYYNVDPKYGSRSITYPTMVEGRQVYKTVDNIGLHVNVYEENSTRTYHIDTWMDYALPVKFPYAALVGTGI